MFFKNKNRKIESNFIFIIGTGRSGTHFIGRAIGNHPRVKLLLEETKNFRLVKKIAILGAGERSLNQLLKRYKKLQIKSNKPWILEKSHPNIWLMESLTSYFPNSIFIGMQRDVYQVVSSMVKHGGVKSVKSWFNLLPQNKNSKFLGINDYNKNYYEELPLEAKCTIRWLSHKFELERLKAIYPERLFVIDYKILCEKFDIEMDKVEKLTGLDLKKYTEKPKLESLTKFKNLSAEQIKIIDDTLTREIPNFNKIYHLENE